jgi:hypothetical protein
MSQTTPVGDFGQWNVEHLRLTIFHPSGVDTSNLWERLMHVLPESRDERPREGVVQQQGEAGGNRLLLITRADRFDWTVIPNPASDAGIMPTPILVDINQAVTLIQDALRISLQAVTVMDRLAFGALLGQQVADPTEGMSRLSEYLPRLGLEEQGVSDFVYQINRRRQSLCVPHAQLNRVARWSSEQIIQGQLRITPALLPQVQPSGTRFVNRLLLDVNTVPGTSAIAHDRFSGLFVELVEIACKVASEGDVI